MHRRAAIESGNGITDGVIWQQLLIFFFPIMLGTFFQQLYNTADAIIVGKFVGKEALAAVGGATGTITNLVVGFFVGLSSGATVIIAQFFGARERDGVSRAVHTAMALSLAFGMLLTVAGIALAPAALEAMGTPEDILPYAVTYIRVYFAGVTAVLIYNIGSGILRAVGDSKRPLYFLIVCCGVNIVLDILLVVGLGMGVFGAALATMISQVVSAVLVIVTLMRTGMSYHFSWKKLGFDPKILGSILQIGLPAGVQSMMYSISNIIIQVCVNGFGTDTVAAFTACGKIDGIVWMIYGAFGVSITTFVGQNFGARRMDRIRKSVRTCMAMAVGSTALLGALLLLFGRPVYRMFTSDEYVVELGMQILSVVAPTYWTYAGIEILAGAVRGTGDSVRPMIMTCVGVCVMRIVWIWAVVPLRPDMFTVMLSYPISWVLTSLLFIVYYKRGAWLKRRLKAAGAEAD